MPERYHGHDPRDRFKGSPTATINQIDGERILSLRTGPLIIAQCTEEKEEEVEKEDALFFVAVKQRGPERARRNVAAVVSTGKPDGILTGRSLVDLALFSFSSSRPLTSSSLEKG